MSGTDAQGSVFDVTLYWHEGGSLFLGTVVADSHAAAEKAALARYVSQSKENRIEIEQGGGFEARAEKLLPAEAHQWRMKNGAN